MNRDLRPDQGEKTTRKFWQRNIGLTVLVVVCCAFSTVAQQKPAASSKTVEGVLYAVGSGQHVTTFLLHTPNRVLTLVANDKTRYVHFDDANKAWGLGARWVVTYRSGGNAISITFTGQKDVAIAETQAAAMQFLNALADKNRKQAYDQLSPTLRRKLSFDDFAQLYKDIEVDMRAVDICSKSEDKVELLLAPSGPDVPPYQPAEAVIIGGKSMIDRLEPFTENPIGCKTP
jgi:hypothetical protein